MRRACARMLAVSVLLWAGLGWAAPAADLHAGAVQGALSGSYLVTFNVRLGTPLPAGGAILCRAHLAPNLAAGAKTRWAVAETATGVATVTGSMARCTVQVPVRWEVEGGGSGGAWSNEAALSYEIDAVSGPGTQAYPVRAEQDIGVPFPAPNSIQSLQIYVLF